MGRLVATDDAEVMQISNSEIQCYKMCKRKWWLTYYRHLVPIREESHGPRTIGNRVHGAVAHYYTAQATCEDAQQQAIDLHDWAVALDIDKFPEDESEIRKEADLSRAMLEGYFEWLAETGADEGMTVVGVEEEVEKTIITPWTKTPVRIRAKLDLRVSQKHPLGVGHAPQTMFLDHKTVQEFTTPTRTLHLDEQMLLYDWLLRWFELPGGVVNGAIYNMLRKVKRSRQAKPPFYERFTVRHTKQELRSFHARLMGELEDIIQTRKRLDLVPGGESVVHIVYPTPTRNCSWACDFFPVCNLIDRPDDKPDQMIARLYQEGDPYKRYDGSGGTLD